MTIHKRKKAVKYRGSKTHGGGAKKKRRGGGHRGGRGRAGTGKRADSKKPTIWKDKYYFGKYGFKKKNKTEINAINLKTLNERIPYWASRKLIDEKSGLCIVDLGKLGYNKLIGAGEITRKLNIAVERATEGAIASVKQAGGNVEVTLKVEEKKNRPNEKEVKEAQ